ncbi:MAG: helix-turn-helix domain-containing protein [Treponema sp.]|nr:helix-turn-helix domain-containing protein [Treponema sp.]
MDQLLNVNELAAYLKCTEQTVRRYVMAKKIPYHKIDRMVRFSLYEILEWVKSGKAKNIGGKKINKDCLFVENKTDEGEHD